MSEFKFSGNYSDAMPAMALRGLTVFPGMSVNFDVERLISEERERAVSETEERMNRQFIAMRSRAQENAVGKRSHRCSPDVSSLTKSERAHLASRALMGEKIKL